MISNSILITGNTFVLLIAGLVLISWIYERYEFSLVLLIVMALMGRGFLYFLLISALIVIFTSNTKLVLNGLKLGITNLRTQLDNYMHLLFFLLIVVFIFLVTSTHLNVFTSDIVNFYRGLFADYEPANSPLLYPVTLLVYLPTTIGLIFSIVFLKSDSKRKIIRDLLLWIIVSLVFVSIYPGHRIIDLVCVSLPLWLLSSFAFVDLLNSNRSNWEFFLRLFIICK